MLYEVKQLNMKKEMSEHMRMKSSWLYCKNCGVTFDTAGYQLHYYQDD